MQKTSTTCHPPSSLSMRSLALLLVVSMILTMPGMTAWAVDPQSFNNPNPQSGYVVQPDGKSPDQSHKPLVGRQGGSRSAMEKAGDYYQTINALINVAADLLNVTRKRLVQDGPAGLHAIAAKAAHDVYGPDPTTAPDSMEVDSLSQQAVRHTIKSLNGDYAEAASKGVAESVNGLLPSRQFAGYMPSIDFLGANGGGADGTLRLQQPPMGLDANLKNLKKLREGDDENTNSINKEFQRLVDLYKEAHIRIEADRMEAVEQLDAVRDRIQKLTKMNSANQLEIRRLEQEIRSAESTSGVPGLDAIVDFVQIQAWERKITLLQHEIDRNLKVINTDADDDGAADGGLNKQAADWEGKIQTFTRQMGRIQRQLKDWSDSGRAADFLHAPLLGGDGKFEYGKHSDKATLHERAKQLHEQNKHKVSHQGLGLHASNFYAKVGTGVGAIGAVGVLYLAGGIGLLPLLGAAAVAGLVVGLGMYVDSWMAGKPLTSKEINQALADISDPRARRMEAYLRDIANKPVDRQFLLDSLEDGVTDAFVGALDSARNLTATGEAHIREVMAILVKLDANPKDTGARNALLRAAALWEGKGFVDEYGALNSHDLGAVLAQAQVKRADDYFRGIANKDDPDYFMNKLQNSGQQAQIAMEGISKDYGDGFLKKDENGRYDHDDVIRTIRGLAADGNTDALTLARKYQVPVIDSTTGRLLGADKLEQFLKGPRSELYTQTYDNYARGWQTTFGSAGSRVPWIAAKQGWDRAMDTFGSSGPLTWVGEGAWGGLQGAVGSMFEPVTAPVTYATGLGLRALGNYMGHDTEWGAWFTEVGASQLGNHLYNQALRHTTAVGYVKDAFGLNFDALGNATDDSMFIPDYRTGKFNTPNTNLNDALSWQRDHFMATNRQYLADGGDVLGSLNLKTGMSALSAKGWYEGNYGTVAAATGIYGAEVALDMAAFGGLNRGIMAATAGRPVVGAALRGALIHAPGMQFSISVAEGLGRGMDAMSAYSRGDMLGAAHNFGSFATNVVGTMVGAGSYAGLHRGMSKVGELRSSASAGQPVGLWSQARAFAGQSLKGGALEAGKMLTQGAMTMLGGGLLPGLGEIAGTFGGHVGTNRIAASYRTSAQSDIADQVLSGAKEIKVKPPSLLQEMAGAQVLAGQDISAVAAQARAAIEITGRAQRALTDPMVQKPTPDMIKTAADFLNKHGRIEPDGSVRFGASEMANVTGDNPVVQKALDLLRDSSRANPAPAVSAGSSAAPRPQPVEAQAPAAGSRNSRPNVPAAAQASSAAGSSRTNPQTAVPSAIDTAPAPRPSGNRSGAGGRGRAPAPGEYSSLGDRETALKTHYARARAPQERRSAANALAEHYRQARLNAVAGGDTAAVRQANKGIQETELETTRSRIGVFETRAQRTSLSGSQERALAGLRLREAQSARALAELELSGQRGGSALRGARAGLYDAMALEAEALARINDLSAAKQAKDAIVPIAEPKSVTELKQADLLRAQAELFRAQAKQAREAGLLSQRLGLRGREVRAAEAGLKTVQRSILGLDFTGRVERADSEIRIAESFSEAARNVDQQVLNLRNTHRDGKFTEADKAELSILEKQARNIIAGKPILSSEGIAEAVRTAREAAGQTPIPDLSAAIAVATRLVDSALQVSAARVRLAQSLRQVLGRENAFNQATHPVSRFANRVRLRLAQRGVNSARNHLARVEIRQADTVLGGKQAKLNGLQQAIKTSTDGHVTFEGRRLSSAEAAQLKRAMELEIQLQQEAAGQKSWRDQIPDSAINKWRNAESVANALATFEAKRDQLAAAAKAETNETTARALELHRDLMDAEAKIIQAREFEQNLTESERANRIQQLEENAQARMREFKQFVQAKYESRYWKQLGSEKPITDADPTRQARMAKLQDETAREALLNELFGRRTLTETEALIFTELLARDVLKYGEGMDVDVMRMIIHNLNGDIIELAMGGGKSTALSAVFGIRSLMGRTVQGHLIVADSKEITKYVNEEYAAFMNAMGIRDVFSGDQRYNEGKNSGDGYAKLKERLAGNGNKVAVFSLDTYGHLARSQKDGDVGLRSVMRANMIGVDEADVAALMRKSFNVGRNVEATDLQKQEVYDLFSHLQSRARHVDISQFRHEMDDYAYSVDPKGRIVYSDKVQNDVLGKFGAKYSPMQITDVLRGMESVRTGEDAVIIEGDVHKADLQAGFQHQTRDQSTYYQIATVMANDAAAGKTRPEILNRKIGLTSHGSEATVSEAFSRVGGVEIEIFGGSGTLDGAQSIAQAVYGVKRVGVVKGARYEDYGFTSHMIEGGQVKIYGENGRVIDSMSIEDFVSKRIHAAFNAEGGARGALAIFDGTASLKRSLYRYFENEIRNDTALDATQRKQALDELTRMINESENGKLINLGRIGLKGVSQESAQGGQSFMDLARGTSGKIHDIAMRIQVIDMFAAPQAMERIAATTAKNPDVDGKPIATFAIERAGRALNFRGKVNEIVIGAEKYNRGDLLQILGRTGRLDSKTNTKFATERDVLVNVEALKRNADVVSRLTTYLSGQEGYESMRRDLRDQLSRMNNLVEKFSGNRAISQEDMGAALRANAYIRLLEAKDGAATFKLSSEVVTKLAKEPLGFMQSVATGEDARILEKAYNKLRSGGYDVSRNTYRPGEFKSTAEIARELFQGGLSQAESLWRELAENTKLSTSMRAEAATRLRDILETKIQTQGLFNGAPRKGNGLAFAQIDPLQTAISGEVAQVVKGLSGDLLPSESSTSRVTEQSAVVEANRAMEAMRARGPQAVPSAVLERIGTQARKAVTANPSLQNTLVARLAMIAQGQSDDIRELLSTYAGVGSQSIPVSSSEASQWVSVIPVTSRVSNAVSSLRTVQLNYQQARQWGTGRFNSARYALSQTFQTGLDAVAQVRFTIRQVIADRGALNALQALQKQALKNPGVVQSVLTDAVVQQSALNAAQLAESTSQALARQRTITEGLSRIQVIARTAPRSAVERGPGYVMARAGKGADAAVVMIVTSMTPQAAVRALSIMDFAAAANVPVRIHVPAGVDLNKAAEAARTTALAEYGHPTLRVDGTKLIDITSGDDSAPAMPLSPFGRLEARVMQIFGASTVPTLDREIAAFQNAVHQMQGVRRTLQRLAAQSPEQAQGLDEALERAEAALAPHVEAVARRAKAWARAIDFNLVPMNDAALKRLILALGGAKNPGDVEAALAQFTRPAPARAADLAHDHLREIGTDIQAALRSGEEPVFVPLQMGAGPNAVEAFRIAYGVFSDDGARLGSLASRSDKLPAYFLRHMEILRRQTAGMDFDQSWPMLIRALEEYVKQPQYLTRPVLEAMKLAFVNEKGVISVNPEIAAEHAVRAALRGIAAEVRDNRRMVLVAPDNQMPTLDAAIQRMLSMGSLLVPRHVSIVEKTPYSAYQTAMAEEETTLSDISARLPALLRHRTAYASQAQSLRAASSFATVVLSCFVAVGLLPGILGTILVALASLLVMWPMVRNIRSASLDGKGAVASPKSMGVAQAGEKPVASPWMGMGIAAAVIVGASVVGGLIFGAPLFAAALSMPAFVSVTAGGDALSFLSGAMRHVRDHLSAAESPDPGSLAADSSSRPGRPAGPVGFRRELASENEATLSARALTPVRAAFSFDRLRRMALSPAAGRIVGASLVVYAATAVLSAKGTVAGAASGGGVVALIAEWLGPVALPALAVVGVGVALWGGWKFIKGAPNDAAKPSGWMEVLSNA